MCFRNSRRSSLSDRTAAFTRRPVQPRPSSKTRSGPHCDRVFGRSNTTHALPGKRWNESSSPWTQEKTRSHSLDDRSGGKRDTRLRESSGTGESKCDDSLDTVMGCIGESLIGEALEILAAPRVWRPLLMTSDASTTMFDTSLEQDTCATHVSEIVRPVVPNKRYTGRQVPAKCGFSTMPLYRVTTTIRSSLEAVGHAFTRPENTVLYEDHVIFNRIVANFANRRGALFHRGYNESAQMYDIVLLQFLNVLDVVSEIVREHCQLSSGVSPSLSKNGGYPSASRMIRLLRSVLRDTDGRMCPDHTRVLVCAGTSVDDPRVPHQDNACRSSIHFTSVIAYELSDGADVCRRDTTRAPGARTASDVPKAVQLIYLVAHDDLSVSPVFSPTELHQRVGRLKSYCEMWEQMSRSSSASAAQTLFLFPQVAQSTAAGNKERPNPRYSGETNAQRSYYEGLWQRAHDTSLAREAAHKQPSVLPAREVAPRLQFRELTPRQRTLLFPLLLLHLQGRWRSLWSHQNCTVEKLLGCVGFRVPVSTFRIETTIHASMEEFVSVLSDPSTLMNYEPFLHSLSVHSHCDSGYNLSILQRPILPGAAPRQFTVESTYAVVTSAQIMREIKGLLPCQDLSRKTLFYNAAQPTSCDAKLATSHTYTKNAPKGCVHICGFIVEPISLSPVSLRVKHVAAVAYGGSSLMSLDDKLAHLACARLARLRDYLEGHKHESIDVGPLSAHVKLNQVTGIDGAASTDSNVVRSWLREVNAHRRPVGLPSGEENLRKSDRTNEHHSHVGSLHPSCTSHMRALSISTIPQRVRKSPSLGTSNNSVPSEQLPPVALSSPKMSTLKVHAMKTGRTNAREQFPSFQSRHNHLRPSSPLPSSPLDTGVRLLRVEVLSCEGLPRHLGYSSASKIFIRVVSQHNRFQTVKIPYDSTCHFDRSTVDVTVGDPRHDALSFIACLDVDDRQVRLGTGMLFMGNMVRHETHYAHVPLVSKAGTQQAKERGHLQVALQPMNYGSKHPLSTSIAEDTLRKKIHAALISGGSLELHKLEWYVGKYRARTLSDVDKLLYRLSCSDDQKPSVRPTPVTPTHRFERSHTARVHIRRAASPRCSSAAVEATESLDLRRRSSSETPLSGVPNTVERSPSIRRHRLTHLCVTVVDIRDLCTDDGLPATDCAVVYVEVSVRPKVLGSLTVDTNRSRALESQSSQQAAAEIQVTKAVPYERGAYVGDVLRFTITVPVHECLHMRLFSGHSRCGRLLGTCELSMEVITVSGDNELRSYYVVKGAGTDKAVPCGRVSLGMQYSVASDSELTDLLVIDNTDRAAAEMRISAFLWKHARAELHRLDLAVVEALKTSLNEYMLTLVKRWGPEPERLSMDLCLQRWLPVTPKTDSQIVATWQKERRRGYPLDVLHDKTQSGQYDVSPQVYFVVHTGLCHYQTPSVPVSASGTGLPPDDSPSAVPINVVLTLTDVLPDVDEVLIAVYHEVGGGKDVECGRIIIPAHLLTNTLLPERLVVPLTKRAGLPFAFFHGNLVLNAAVRQRSSRTPQIPWMGFDVNWPPRQEMASLLYRRSPEELHALFRWLARGKGRESAYVKEVASRYEGLKETVSMSLRLVGVRNWSVATPFYIKAYFQGDTVLRTSDVTCKASALSLESRKYMASITVDDPKHSMVLFKVGKHNLLMRSETVATAELCVPMDSEAQDGMEVVTWLPLFRVNEPRHLLLSTPFIGELGVVFCRSEGEGAQSRIPRPMSCHSGGDAKSSIDSGVHRDVISLLQKYAPTELRQVQPLVAQCGVSPGFSEQLRREFAPQRIAGTVYLHVHSFCRALPGLLTEYFPTGGDKEGLFITAMYSTDGGCCQCPLSTSVSKEMPAPLQAGSTYIRIDIPEPMTFTEVEEDAGLEFVLHCCSWNHIRGRSSSRRSSSTGRFPSAHPGQRRSSIHALRRSHSLASFSTSRTEQFASSFFTTQKASPSFPQGDISTVELGRARVSLRALLTPELYDHEEIVTVPLLAHVNTITSRLALPQQRLFQTQLKKLQTSSSHDLFTLGTLSFTISVPVNEVPLQWMRLPRMEQGLAARAYIRYFSDRIQEVLQSNDPGSLVAWHFVLYERHVGSGIWPYSLPNMRRALVGKFGVQSMRSKSEVKEPPLPAVYSDIVSPPVNTVRAAGTQETPLSVRQNDAGCTVLSSTTPRQTTLRTDELTTVRRTLCQQSLPGGYPVMRARRAASHGSGGPLEKKR